MNALENLHDGPTMSTSISNYISTYIRTNTLVRTYVLMNIKHKQNKLTGKYNIRCGLN